jgi:hypothetical protein
MSDEVTYWSHPDMQELTGMMRMWVPLKQVVPNGGAFAVGYLLRPFPTRASAW